MRASKGLMKDYNFIEGMICSGGCIGGAGCLTHGEANRKGVEKYGKDSTAETIKGAIERAEEKGV